LARRPSVSFLKHTPLPEFGRPPVHETVLSIQFAPIEDLGTLHFGLLWGRLKGDFPTFQIVPPLEPVFERFGEEPQERPTFRFERITASGPTIRCWFLDKFESRLLQFQADRFVYNWRRTEHSPDYPRFARILPAFREEWKRFCGFLNDEGFEIPSINQCEVTYINHVEVELGNGVRVSPQTLFPMFQEQPAGGFLPRLSSLRGGLIYDFPDRRGRLHVTFKPATRKSDGAEIIILELTARGEPIGQDFPSAVQWLELGHEWVVRAFAEVTSPEMQAHWERRQ
jgi:uncharacterized protein (TIGR04255 family)